MGQRANVWGMTSLQRRVESYFISSCQRSAMTSRARLEWSHADLEQFGSLVPLITLLSFSDKPSSHRMILQRGFDLNGCRQLTVVKEMRNESVCSLVRVTSKLEILTYLYSEPVSSTGQRLQRWSRRQENKYHYRRANTRIMWREWHSAAPPTAHRYISVSLLSQYRELCGVENAVIHLHKLLFTHPK